MSSITECVHLGPCNRRLTKSKSERDLRSGPLERQEVPARARRSVFPSLPVKSTKGRWLSADSGGSLGGSKRKEERREVQAGRDERLSTKRVWRAPQVAVTGCRHRIPVAKKWVRLVRRADPGVGPRRLQSRDTCPKHRGTRVTNWGIRSRTGTGGGGQSKQGRGQGDTKSQASLGKPGGRAGGRRNSVNLTSTLPRKTSATGNTHQSAQWDTQHDSHKHNTQHNSVPCILPPTHTENRCNPREA